MDTGLMLRLIIESRSLEIAPPNKAMDRSPWSLFLPANLLLLALDDHLHKTLYTLTVFPSFSQPLRPTLRNYNRPFTQNI